MLLKSFYILTYLERHMEKNKTLYEHVYVDSEHLRSTHKKVLRE